MKITYSKQGDYNLPNLKLPKHPKAPDTYYTRRRKEYLEEHRELLYYNLLTSCKLTAHLIEINERAYEMEDRLTAELAQKEGVTAELKASDQMEWVRRMNNIKARVREIILSEIIYV